MKAQTVKQVLQAAHWIIDNVGWCQESYYLNHDGTPNYNLGNSEGVCAACLTGAIYLVKAEPQKYAVSTLNDQAESLLKQRLPGDGIVSFNDAPERTKQQVLDALQETINSLE